VKNKEVAIKSKNNPRFEGKEGYHLNGREHTMLSSARQWDPDLHAEQRFTPRNEGERSNQRTSKGIGVHQCPIDSAFDH
jgi:hypothetical protein